MAKHKNISKDKNRRINNNPSGKKAPHPAPQPFSTSKANKMPPPMSLPHEDSNPSEKGPTDSSPLPSSTSEANKIPPPMSLPQENSNPSEKGPADSSPPPSSTSEANKMPQQAPLPNDEKTSLIPFKTKMWLIFGVGISLLAIVAAAIFDWSFGAGFEKIRDSRYPDFILATLAISASVINIIIDLNAEIDINKKINYAIFPSITATFSLAYYSFLYGISEKITSLKWDWVLPISFIVLLINIYIGIILSKK